MSRQEAQMNPVGSSGVGVGVGGTSQHQAMQDMAGLAGMDQQFVMLRTNMREKIYEYIGRKQMTAEWQPRLPELAKRLEEILFSKFSNKNDYCHMMEGPIEPQLQFAIRTSSAQNQQNHQNKQMSRQVASSSGTITMIPTPGMTLGTTTMIPTPGMTLGTTTMIPTGMTLGTTGNTRFPYVTDNNALSSSGAGMVAQNADMGTSMPESVDMAGFGSFYATGSSALTTPNSQSISAADVQARSGINPMLFSNQLNIQSIQPQSHIKTEVLDQPENGNFQSPQWNHEQLFRQQQHQEQHNSQSVQNQYHLNQQQPNPEHQPIYDVVGLAEIDAEFVMLRNNMREKIFQYIGRKQSSAEWQRLLPELVRRLEEIFFRKFSNKNDYYNMMKGPIEPQLQFAIKTVSAQNQRSQQNQQMSRQIASSSCQET
ncbi:probable histone acetyltransferase HAC-like 1 isoform X2 [Phragmites australis]|uniref:probable histone acetyltransferase HAC-like 1 isoform X2 n=1 Tax=Phragmites australis TaxID=29695 RepID=UPI002D7A3C8C|nr:probable histone acetyltransferase HAC-like 1 isoform X2 [Phragmites australis]